MKLEAKRCGSLAVKRVSAPAVVAVTALNQTFQAFVEGEDQPVRPLA